jgi:anti-anti-sigma factor
MATAPQVEDAVRELRAAGFDHIVLDLAEVTFIDSTGLRLVLDTRHGARADGYRLTLLPGPAAVQRVFTVAGLSDLF